MSAKLGSLSIACVQLGPRKLSVIRSSGVSLFRGCLRIEVNGRLIGTFRIVRYIVGVRYSGVSVVTGYSSGRGPRSKRAVSLSTQSHLTTATKDRAQTEGHIVHIHSQKEWANLYE